MSIFAEHQHISLLPNFIMLVLL